ncbi:MAG TPA: periplasmic heavy metal sensor [Verrucomicrobiales bacterium]|nr:periplasmic heavy metal sensor [Verrucomicrobiales bacterium]
MNRTRLAIWWLLSSAVVGGLSAWGVLHWHVVHEHSSAGSAHGHAVDSEERFHAWVHENLNLTPAQHAALDEKEQSFAARRKELRDAMRNANAALRDAISRDRADSPAVQAAENQLATAQAALQRATLTHLFEMAANLDESARRKVIQWTHDSLQPHP